MHHKFAFQLGLHSAIDVMLPTFNHLTGKASGLDIGSKGKLGKYILKLD